MNREYKEALAGQIEKNFSVIEEEVMQDIVRRIQMNQKITSTAEWQINRLQMLGNSSEDIERMLKEALNASYPQMFELYDKVIDWEYVRNKDIYEQINQKFIPFEENLQLKQLAGSIIQQTKGELGNITQSLGFYLDYGNGQRVLTPLAQVYQVYLDQAMYGIASGMFDYNTALRNVVTQLTNSGLRQIDYASGMARRVNVAARSAVMTGVTQLIGHISDYNADTLGTDYFEVAWHAGARPTHQEWQGKVYTREQLVTICGLGSVTGLEGANCYHERYPFFPGLSGRNWSDAWLEEQNRKENTPKEFKGKEYTAYGARQRQRQMETAMRAQRQKVKLLQEGKADPDDIMLARAKYQGQLDEYGRFCKKMGLPQERERIYLDMQGRVATNTIKVNARYTAEMIANAEKDSKQYKRYRNILGKDVGSLADFRQMKYNNPKRWEYIKGIKEYLVKYPTSSKQFYDIQEELKSLGITKGVVLPPVQKQAFIIPEGKHDPYHIMHRMMERHISDDEIRDYMENAKAMFVQWGGKRQTFFGENGVSVITKSGDDWIYKTTWNKTDFDDNTLKILEVINKHVR